MIGYTRMIVVLALGIAVVVAAVLWHVTSADGMVLRLLETGRGPDPAVVTARKLGGEEITSSDPKVLAYFGCLMRGASEFDDELLHGEAVSGSLDIGFSLGRQSSPRIEWYPAADAMMIVANDGLSYRLYVVRLAEDTPDEFRAMLEVFDDSGRNSN